MQRTLCDWCSASPLHIAMVNDAEFRVQFERLTPPFNPPPGDNSSDRPIDLCRMHYEALWAVIKSKGVPSE